MDAGVKPWHDDMQDGSYSSPVLTIASKAAT
jgi:hypothetical protein